MGRKDADPIIFDLFVRRLMIDRTLRDVAADAGVGRGTIADAERGNHSPTLSTLRRWASVLDMDIVIIEKDADIVRRADADKLHDMLAQVSAIADWCAARSSSAVRADLVELKIRTAIGEHITDKPCTCVICLRKTNKS